MVLLLMFVYSASSAQSASSYRGTVKDSGGEPLIGVSVVIKGTTNGVITNFDGEYSITAKPGDVLVFSYVGMKRQEIPVSGRRKIDLVMEEEKIDLGEVVVMGYSSDSKKLIANSASLMKLMDRMGNTGKSA